MASVKVISGIFRKLGKKEAIEFIEGIVTLPDFLLKGSADHIQKWLLAHQIRDGKVRFGGGGTCCHELVIKEFNEQYE